MLCRSCRTRNLLRGLNESDALHLLSGLWRVPTWRFQEKVADAPLALLLESGAASAEQAWVTAGGIDQRSTT